MLLLALIDHYPVTLLPLRTALGHDYTNNTQMVAIALGPWASHLEDRVEP